MLMLVIRPALDSQDLTDVLLVIILHDDRLLSFFSRCHRHQVFIISGDVVGSSSSWLPSEIHATGCAHAVSCGVVIIIVVVRRCNTSIYFHQIYLAHRYHVVGQAVSSVTHISVKKLFCSFLCGVILSIIPACVV